MENLIKDLHSSLLKKKMTIAAAESCTGGMLSEYLTRLSKSSNYFILGVTAYSNKAKTGLLKVPAGVIAKYGAVSEQAAAAMAAGVKKLAGSDIGVSITGIAGPTGATADKPVGTVFIAVKHNSAKICKEFRFKGDRQAIRKLAALKAMRLLYESLYRH